MYGDKIVLLDGAGAGTGAAATNSMLSMMPALFANAFGGNKMDPNLVAALMNGKDNKDSWGGAGCWWMWIILLFFLWGGRGFGNGMFGNESAIAGIPNQLNNATGRELLMQAIQGNRSAIDQIASALNCSSTQLQSSICNIQGAIDRVAGQVGMTSQGVINAVQSTGCEIGNAISSCCCNLQSLINQSTCSIQNSATQNANAIQNAITSTNYENQLSNLNQTNTLQNSISNGFTNNREQATSQFNILSAKIDAQTQILSEKFCELEKRELQNKIDALRDRTQTLEFAASQQAQTANLINQLRPVPVPAYPSCSPYQSYAWGQVANVSCCNNGCSCNNA